ncbi:MAG: peptidase U32 [Firmicutes bacterium HGW-Firmicutes-11]|nr:MAG: peptidase U32 [Firmicutes bacterium HGW-Firmicutes-11]
MIKLPELLAPVGGPQQLIAAIENRADAVYLGGKLFNARINASNFENEDLRSAIEFAHIRGANVYITLNTLVNDREMEQALEYAAFVYKVGADALIVQDIGFAGLLREHLPDFSMHFSTQGTVYNLEGVRMAERLGARRVVLARELSLNEIEKIAEQTNMELEIFVHGALCQSYSGQCYLSSMIGGRSGNRGSCAQPCRLPYSLLSEGGDGRKTLSGKGYLLSPKDLSSLEHLSQLVKTGVRSLKIEGRMKSPEYVAIVTGTYRKYLDALAEGAGSAVTPSLADSKAVKQIYNRGGFTTGYLFSKPGRDLITRDRAKHEGVYLGKVVGRDERMRSVQIKLEDELSMGDGIEIVNDALPGNLVTMMQKNGERIQHAEPGETINIGYVDGPVKRGDLAYKISDKALNKKAGETFSGKYLHRVPVTGHLTALLGEPLRFQISDPDGNQIEIIGDYVPVSAINTPLLPETAKTQIAKTGSTPFAMAECTFVIGENVSVPLSEINSIRRKALDDLIEIRRNRYPNRTAPQIVTGTNGKSAECKNIAEIGSATPRILSVYLYQWKNKEVMESITADRVYLPVFSLFDDDHAAAVKRFKERGIQVFAAVPAVTRGVEDHMLKERADSLQKIGIEGILIGNLSQVELLADARLPLFGDHSLNIYNSESIKKVAEFGLKGGTLSHELNLAEIQQMDGFGIEIEATVYGRVPVMISEHCPIGSELSDRPDSINCGLCLSGRYLLKDRMEAEFPLIGDPISCRCTLLHCDKLYVPERITDLTLAGVTTYRQYIDDESPEEIIRIGALLQKMLLGENSNPSKQKGYTKGHYNKGV